MSNSPRSTLFKEADRTSDNLLASHIGKTLHVKRLIITNPLDLSITSVWPTNLTVCPEIEHDPCWGMVARVFLPTRTSVNTAVHEAV